MRRTLKLKLELNDGTTGYLNISDIDEMATDQELVDLAMNIVQKDVARVKKKTVNALLEVNLVETDTKTLFS